MQLMASGVLALLGFAACSDNNEIENEYGTPTISYSATGVVTDESGIPIKGIQVIDNYPYSFPDTTYTDEKGEFQIAKKQVTGWGEDSFKGYKMKFNDTGSLNNEQAYRSDSASIKDMTVTQTENKKGSWNFGTLLITVKKKLTRIGDSI
jgi:putative lipoprotein (rSAM/lipoprotein system)